MAAPNILCDCTGMTNEMWLKCREHGPKGNIEYLSLIHISEPTRH